MLWDCCCSVFSGPGKNTPGRGWPQVGLLSDSAPHKSSDQFQAYLWLEKHSRVQQIPLQSLWDPSSYSSLDWPKAPSRCNRAGKQWALAFAPCTPRLNCLSWNLLSAFKVNLDKLVVFIHFFFHKLGERLGFVKPPVPPLETEAEG